MHASRHAPYVTMLILKVPHCTILAAIAVLACCYVLRRSMYMIATMHSHRVCTGGQIGLKKLLRRFIDFRQSNKKNNKGGRSYQRAAPGAQTCAYCRLLPGDNSVRHRFQAVYPISGANGRGRGRGHASASGANGRGRRQIGCLRYEEGREFFRHNPNQHPAQPENPQSRESEKRKYAHYMAPMGESRVKVCHDVFCNIWGVRNIKEICE